MQPLQQYSSFGLATMLLALVIFILAVEVAGKDECQPYKWEAKNQQLAKGRPTHTRPPRPTFTFSVPDKNKHEPGEINCRSWGKTYGEVNYYSCKKLALSYNIDVETFFMLNPILDSDCEEIRPYTKYCVAGFVEPKRATDGLCGPKHGNATCVGTDKVCCNSETWTCGNSDEDCAPGTCYEGLCPGHKVYTTDGTCGRDHGMRMCVGKWGECCNNEGECGSGCDYCAQDKCQLGQCEYPHAPSLDGQPKLPWLVGNTTDGTCGGPQRLTCSVAYGECCNKHGHCGVLPADCGDGCQPQFGKCRTALTPDEVEQRLSPSSNIPVPVRP